MKEDSPYLNLNLGDGRKIKLTRDVGAVYTFAGQTAIGDMMFDNGNADHIFIQTGQEEETPCGLYVFRAFNPQYLPMLNFMADNMFPMMLNLRTVPLCDMEAYMREVDRTTATFTAGVPDFLPDDFQ